MDPGPIIVYACQSLLTDSRPFGIVTALSMNMQNMQNMQKMQNMQNMQNLQITQIMQNMPIEKVTKKIINVSRGGGDFLKNVLRRFPEILINSNHYVDESDLSVREWPWSTFTFLRCVINILVILMHYKHIMTDWLLEIHANRFGLFINNVMSLACWEITFRTIDNTILLFSQIYNSTSTLKHNIKNSTKRHHLIISHVLCFDPFQRYFGWPKSMPVTMKQQRKF